MHIKPGELICGCSALTLRSVFKKTPEYAVLTQKTFVTEMGITSSEAQELIQRLVKGEYLVESTAHQGRYHLTIKASALAMASAAKQIHRKTADQLIEGFLERVRSLNGDPEFGIRITKVTVFGSYVSDVERLSDVDIGIEWERKPEYADCWDAFVKTRVKKAAEAGKVFHHFLDQLYWPEAECWRYLKNGKKSLSLHDEIPQGANARVLWEQEADITDRE